MFIWTERKEKVARDSYRVLNHSQNRKTEARGCQDWGAEGGSELGSELTIDTDLKAETRKTEMLKSEPDPTSSPRIESAVRNQMSEIRKIEDLAPGRCRPIDSFASRSLTLSG